MCLSCKWPAFACPISVGYLDLTVENLTVENLAVENLTVQRLKLEGPRQLCMKKLSKDYK